MGNSTQAIILQSWFTHRVMSALNLKPFPEVLLSSTPTSRATKRSQRLTRSASQKLSLMDLDQNSLSECNLLSNLSSILDLPLVLLSQAQPLIPLEALPVKWSTSPSKLARPNTSISTSTRASMLALMLALDLTWSTELKRLRMFQALLSAIEQLIMIKH